MLIPIKPVHLRRARREAVTGFSDEDIYNCVCTVVSAFEFTKDWLLDSENSYLHISNIN